MRKTVVLGVWICFLLIRKESLQSLVGSSRRDKNLWCVWNPHTHLGVTYTSSVFLLPTEPH